MSERVELSKEQMVSVKKGHIENDICRDLANPFVHLIGRGIWLWHDSVKGICRSIKSQEVKDKVDKFVTEAYNIQKDKSVTNLKFKTAQIVKLWIEGISLCFEEMAEDLNISESQTMQLASLVMISVLKESDNSTRSITELKENLIKRIRILKGEE